MATIPNHVPQYLRNRCDLSIEHTSGDRVQFRAAKAVGTVIAVTRRKELTWRDSERLRRSGTCESWVGQQMVLVRWDNGKEGGFSPDHGLKWQPAYIFEKIN